MFAGEGSSAPSSCCSSRAPTPSIPHGSSMAAAAHLASDGSGEGGSTGVHSRLDGFQLPPAALPAQPQLPFAAEQWPALPSSQDSCSSAQDSGTAAARPKEAPAAAGMRAGQALCSSSSSSEVNGSGASRDCGEASVDCEGLHKPGSMSAESSQHGSRHTGVQQDSQACGSLQHPHAAAAAAAASAGAPGQPAAQADPGRGKGAAVAAWAGSTGSSAYTELAPASITVHSTDAGSEQGMLPPLTPHQYQSQQARQQEPYFHHQPQQRQPQQGSAELGLCPAGCAEAPSSSAFTFGVSWDGSSVGRSSLDGSVAAGCGTPYGMLHNTPGGQFAQPQSGALALSRGLDLDALRTRSALVANACLHGLDQALPAVCAPGCCTASSAACPLVGDEGCLPEMMAGYTGVVVMEAGLAGCCLDGHHHHHHQEQRREQAYHQQQHMRMMAAEAAAAAASVYGGCVGGMMPFQPGDSLPPPVPVLLHNSPRQRRWQQLRRLCLEVAGSRQPAWHLVVVAAAQAAKARAAWALCRLPAVASWPPATASGNL